MRVALQLAQHQPDLVEAWHGDDRWRPGARVPVRAIHQELRSVRASLDQVKRGLAAADISRATYLRGQLTALGLAAERLLGQSRPFAEETELAFSRPLLQPAPQALEEARRALDEALPGTGSLGARHAALRQTYAVPLPRVEAVLKASIAACRAATGAHIALPEDEQVDLRFGVDSPWDGYARYHGQHRSTIEISGRRPLDISRALHLACHEAYPGHHLQQMLIEGAASDRAELRLVPAFGPHLLLGEGAAEAGTWLALPDAERARVYESALFPLAGLAPAGIPRLIAVERLLLTLEDASVEIIGAYVDSRMSHQAALDALARDAAVAEPGTLLAFAERNRTRAVTYPLGRRIVEEHLRRGTPDAWSTLVELFTTRPFALE